MRQPNAEDENLWSKILDDVQSKSSSSMPQASILILGNYDAGKTSLVAKLQRVNDPKKGSGLEYHYLEVNPDFRDGLFAYQLGSALPDVVPGESTRLGVWVLDGDPGHVSLLKYALPPPHSVSSLSPLPASSGVGGASLERNVVLLTASMAEPGAVMEALQGWARTLERQLGSTDSGFDKRTLAEAREKQIRFWQEYVEPLDSSSHSDMGAKVPSMETDHILLPLGDSILTHNVGLPIIVVITKCDAMSTLEKEYDFKDEHFDFIQQHVRKFCLQYGAALVYTSAKNSRNMDVLYKYILNRVYGFPFTQPASVVEKDSIFIPAGWDNEKKIAILYENMTSLKPTDPYGEHIKKAALKRPQQREVEVQAENDQGFLTRQLNIITTQTPPQAQAASMANRQSESGTKNLPLAAGASQEGVLAQFFNNLLSKKTTGLGSSPNAATALGGGGLVATGGLHPTVSLPGGPKPMDKMNLSNDAAAAELDRMLGNNNRTKSSDAVTNLVANPQSPLSASNDGQTNEE